MQLKNIAKLIGMTSRRSVFLVLLFMTGFLILSLSQIAIALTGEIFPTEDIRRSVITSQLFVIIFLLSFISLAGWMYFTDGGKALVEELERETQSGFTIFRGLKVLFASYGVSIAGLILIVTVGPMITNYDSINAIVEEYMFYVITGITLVVYPWMYTRLK